MLKRNLGLYPHPLVGCIAIVQPASVQTGNVAAGKGYNHVSGGLEYPRGDRSEIDGNPEGQSRVYDMTS